MAGQIARHKFKDSDSGTRAACPTEIWDSIAECPEEIELIPLTRKLLAKRLAAYRTNPDAGSPWSEVKRRII